MSNFYRTIDYPSYFALQQQLAQYALELDLVHSPVPNYYTLQDLPSLLIKAPLIVDFMEKVNLTPISVGWSVSNIYTNSKIHIDHNLRGGRIEIPVMGCGHSYTAFYSAPVSSKAEQKNGSIYWLCDETRAQELDRFTLTHPAFMRVDKPYMTKVTRLNVQRISLGIVTDSDPLHFI